MQFPRDIYNDNEPKCKFCANLPDLTGIVAKILKKTRVSVAN